LFLLFRLDYSSLLAQAFLPLEAAVRGHQDLHFFSLQLVWGRIRTVVSTWFTK
jgi:hypothetical protein